MIIHFYSICLYLPLKNKNNMPTKTLKTPVQKRSIATRNKLKKAARRLFAKYGYYKVTSIQIAKAAGVPVGSFYNYFGNKEGILLELIEDFNQAFHQEVVPKVAIYIENTIDRTSAIENLAHIFELILHSEHLIDPFYKMFHALQFTEDYALQQTAKARDLEIDYLERFLTKVDQFHSVPNIPLTARLLFTTGENLNLYMNHLEPLADSEELLKEMTLMFERYVFGGGYEFESKK